MGSSEAGMVPIPTPGDVRRIHEISQESRAVHGGVRHARHRVQRALADLVGDHDAVLEFEATLDGEDQTAVVEGNRPPQHRRPIPPQVRAIDNGIGVVLDHNTGFAPDLLCAPSPETARTRSFNEGDLPAWTVHRHP